MYYTNNYDCPEPLYHALVTDEYEHRGDISVTSLIQPPRIYQLGLRHSDEITIDAIDNIWMLLGKIAHKIVEEKDAPNGFKEERLYLDIAGWKVAAKPDLWMAPHTLHDYKLTTVWTYIFGLKIEWEQQMNCYAPFYTDAGFPVHELEIDAIFRDHQKSKAKRDKDYPPVAFKRMLVPVWSLAYQMTFLGARVGLHQLCQDMQDAELPLCTPEERWEKPTIYAVMREGRKSSLKNFDNEQQANEFLKVQPGKVYIETRIGKSPRCEDYCNVQPFCNQYKEAISEHLPKID